MLFVYPEAATADNWLHDALRHAIGAIHASAQAGQACPPWPNMLPDIARPRLRRRTGLRTRLDAYRAAADLLDAPGHVQALAAIGNQNRIADLLAGGCDCARFLDLPAVIREPALELFTFAFDLLTDLGLRDAQYKAIFEYLGSKVCPFCGCEYFDAPNAPREALDHYLARSVYPFAGANLRNLAPMGTKCNSHYKRDTDMIMTPAGPRRAFDPYGNQSARISLDRSELFARNGGELPRWEIDIEPNSPEAETWDRVFSLRERYRRDVLDVQFKTWVGWFGVWCRSAGLSPATQAALLDALDRYLTTLVAMGNDERAFLRAALFRLLRNHCADGNERLILLLIDVVRQQAAIAN